MRQVVGKKKSYHTHQKEKKKKKRLSVGFSLCFWIPPDYWIPLGLMKPSELFDVENINNLDLGTSKLKLGPYSAT